LKVRVKMGMCDQKEAFFDFPAPRRRASQGEAGNFSGFVDVKN
jgi:hypothetical protein